jgi:hypothetical protein
VHSLNLRTVKGDVSKNARQDIRRIAIQGLLDDHRAAAKWYIRVLKQYGTISDVKFLLSSIKSGRVSVFYKDGLTSLERELQIK